jgi:23S rRNA pseudouridine1911/1915/1917 synthase
MIDPQDSGEDTELTDLDSGEELFEVVLGLADTGRLDKVLSERIEFLSRARLQALISEGLLTFNGSAVSSASQKAVPGLYQLAIPAPMPAEPQPQDLDLDILFEDRDLIVINKAAGVAVHPAPGTWDRTLVNGLLFHCAGQLSGIGGVARPGIVHRLDKGTSGVMVAAKSDAAHQGLVGLFAKHDIDRVYTAIVRGHPRPSTGTLTTRIGRSPHDRKKMAVLKSGGREATTHYHVVQSYGAATRPDASLVECRLETGRTHQIRVHMASLSSPCLADPVYGGGSASNRVSEILLKSGLSRQALHASVLGFVHPITGVTLRFETDLAPDMSRLRAGLSEL